LNALEDPGKYILEIRFGFMLVLECYTLLDLIELGFDPRIIFIAIGVKSSQCLQTFVGSVVVDEPL